MQRQPGKPGRPPGKLYPHKSSVYLTEEDARLLERLAEKRDRPAAAVIRDLIREAAKREGAT